MCCLETAASPDSECCVSLFVAQLVHCFCNAVFICRHPADIVVWRLCVWERKTRSTAQMKRELWPPSTRRRGGRGRARSCQALGRWCTEKLKARRRNNLISIHRKHFSFCYMTTVVLLLRGFLHKILLKYTMYVFSLFNECNEMSGKYSSALLFLLHSHTCIYLLILSDDIITAINKFPKCDFYLQQSWMDIFIEQQENVKQMRLIVAKKNCFPILLIHHFNFL